MKTFKITNTRTNTTTTEEHESIEQAWRSIELIIALQAHEDIANNGLEENWQDYYSTEYHAHAAHALNFLHLRRKEYEIVELKEPTKTIYIDHNHVWSLEPKGIRSNNMKTELTLTAIETVASNFLETYELTYSNAEYYTDFLTLSIRFEGPNNWTIGLEVDLEDIETVEELTKAVEHEYLREVEYTSVDEYFNEMYDNVSREFTASEFLRMLEEDMKHFQSVVKKINGVDESIVTGDISTIIYNLEQMDFTPEEILYRLEEALKGYTFELDTVNGDAITLKGSN